MLVRRAFDFDQCGGVDGLGRELPAGVEAGPARTGRYTGIFYFLWLGQHGTSGPYDNTRILAECPEAVHNPEHPAWGPPEAFHFWGEPLYGYYFNDDEWVLRRHMELLTSAGVDFLVFDTTNAVTYKSVYDKLFRVMDHIFQQGFRVPQFVFYTNTESGNTIKEIYEDIYMPRRYEHLWFHWKGKPLIIGDPKQCEEELRQFFTFRLNQWPNEEAKENGFPWIEFQRPQRVFFNDEGEKEIVSVSVAQHPSIAMSDTPFYGYGANWGRDYRAGMGTDGVAETDAIQSGMNVAEQWEFALAEDPQLVFVTGWNEWIAMRLKGNAERPVLFVDQATLNFSRDIEPMKGGYGDHYYMQLAGYIRRFKGVSAQHAISFPPLNRQLTIDGSFEAWKDVEPEFRSFAGARLNRDHPGYGGRRYTNATGRNDFIVMKAAHTADSLYFYARTAEDITPHTDSQWMMLLIRIVGEESAGWEGYHYIVNRKVINESKTLLERSLGGWRWETVAELDYCFKGTELQLEVPRALLPERHGGEKLRLQFKWADNALHDGDAMDFYQYGDTAPAGRMNYVYEAE